MNKDFFIGSWKGQEFILVDMDIAGSVLDENGEVSEKIKSIVPTFFVNIKEDGTFELEVDKAYSGKWIELESSLGLIPNEDYEKLKRDGFSDEEIAMPFTKEEDKLLGDLGPFKVRFVK